MFRENSLHIIVASDAILLFIIEFVKCSQTVQSSGEATFGGSRFNCHMFRNCEPLHFTLHFPFEFCTWKSVIIKMFLLTQFSNLLTKTSLVICSAMI